MSEYKKLAVQALNSMRGDDLYRARNAFKGMNALQMQEQFGQSGKTRQQILDEYEAHEQKIDAALEWLHGVKE